MMNNIMFNEQLINNVTNDMKCVNVKNSAH